MQGMDYVYAVYREKSFSAAARRLYVSQPALSAAVKKAEQELGQPIFDRGAVPLQLTPAGKAYIAAAEKIRAIQKELKSYCDSLAPLESGSLSVGGTNVYASCFLPHMLGRFAEKYPNIALHVMEASSRELAEKLLTEELDVVVDAGSYDRQLYEAVPFSEEHILLAVPKEHPLNGRFAAAALTQQDIIAGRHRQADVPPVELSAFAAERFLLLKRGNDMYRRARTLCREAGFVPQARLLLNQLMTAYHMGQQGLGCTFLTDALVRLGSPGSRMAYYKLAGEAAVRESFFLVRRGSARTPAMQELMRLGIALYQGR